MKIRRSLFIILILLSLSCKTLTRAFEDLKPTATPLVENGVYIPPGCQGQAVATIPAATTVAKPTSSLSTNPEISKAEQLRVFDDLTDKIGKVYLYPDFNGLDWKGTVAKYRAKINAGLDTETFYMDMEELVTALNDDHSSFLSPVDVAASNAELNGENDYVGIGILILPMPQKGRVTLLSVLPDSSAEHGGLKPHDNILAIDGLPIAENGIDYSLRVRGPECSAVKLRIQTPGEAPRDELFIRYHITAGVSIVARLVATTDGSRIGYIFIPTFFDETVPGQIKKALQDFGPLDGLILDNRMNGGGSSAVVYPIFSYFTSGTIGHFVSRTNTEALTITADPVANSQTVPLVVLVGTDTVSFGEIFSGALQDIGRAKVVGQTTLGNVEILQGSNFDDGSEAWIAAERFDPLNSHADWEKTGIIPDVTAYADWDTFTFENDPSVAAAVKLLGHR